MGYFYLVRKIYKEKLSIYSIQRDNIRYTTMNTNQCICLKSIKCKNQYDGPCGWVCRCNFRADIEKCKNEDDCPCECVCRCDFRADIEMCKSTKHLCICDLDDRLIEICKSDEHQCLCLCGVYKHHLCK